MGSPVQTPITGPPSLTGGGVAESTPLAAGASGAPGGADGSLSPTSAVAGASGGGPTQTDMVQVLAQLQQIVTQLAALLQALQGATMAGGTTGGGQAGQPQGAPGCTCACTCPDAARGVGNLPVQQLPGQVTYPPVQQLPPPAPEQSPPAALPSTTQQTPPPVLQGPSGPMQGVVQGLAGKHQVASIDVSHWQGNIDWTRVRAAGIQAAFVKASEAEDFVDDKYDRNREQANAAGIPVAAYHYARPGTNGGSVAADARAEAEHFLRTAKVRRGDMAPVLDLEEHGSLSKSQVAEWVKEWGNVVRQHVGVDPILYTSPGFWSGFVADDSAAAGYRLWIANWGVDKPSIPDAWQSAIAWQYTNEGSVDGISGNVDRDVIADPASLIIT